MLNGRKRWWSVLQLIIGDDFLVRFHWAEDPPWQHKVQGWSQSAPGSSEPSTSSPRPCWLSSRFLPSWTAGRPGRCHRSRTCPAPSPPSWGRAWWGAWCPGSAACRSWGVTGGRWTSGPLSCTWSGPPAGSCWWCSGRPCCPPSHTARSLLLTQSTPH